MAGLLVALLGSGCNDFEVRSGGPCSPSASADSTHPFHTIDIDDRNDFADHHEGFHMQAGDTSYHTFVTWDACRIYFGMKAPGIAGSPCPPDDPGCTRVEDVHPRTLMLYLDTDPTDDHGTVYARNLIDSTFQLPFKADYLVEVRTQSRPLRRGESVRFTGNAQLYRRAIQWTAGLIRHWEPLEDSGLRFNVDRQSHYLELSLDRTAIGSPCSLKMIGWVADQMAHERELFWPPPDSTPPMSPLSLNYYGFNLRENVTPNTPSNFNRTDFDAAGRCPP